MRIYKKQLVTIFFNQFKVQSKQQIKNQLNEFFISIIYYNSLWTPILIFLSFFKIFSIFTDFSFLSISLLFHLCQLHLPSFFKKPYIYFYHIHFVNHQRTGKQEQYYHYHKMYRPLILNLNSIHQRISTQIYILSLLYHQICHLQIVQYMFHFQIFKLMFNRQRYTSYHLNNILYIYIYYFHILHNHFSCYVRNYLRIQINYQYLNFQVSLHQKTNDSQNSLRTQILQAILVFHILRIYSQRNFLHKQIDLSTLIFHYHLICHYKNSPHILSHQNNIIYHSHVISNCPINLYIPYMNLSTKFLQTLKISRHSYNLRVGRILATL